MTAVRAAFDRRVVPGRALAEAAPAIAAACRDMAARFRDGGRLLVFGPASAASDVEHVAVEFVHPVIVGKRALPALAVGAPAAARLGVLGRAHDIALGICPDGDDPELLAAVAAAARRGMLTVVLSGTDGGAFCGERLAAHCIAAGSSDPRVIKEMHVTAYHLLWELVHVFLDAAEELGSADAGADLGNLYPFLYGGSGGDRDLLTEVARSSADKVADVAALRAQVAAESAAGIDACARALATRFAAGGTLFAFGNGGSSTDAHDLVGTFLGDPAPVPAVCLTDDVAVVTALTNDVGFDVVFARQLRALGSQRDIACGISTSGGSANVLAALDEAKRMGMLTVGIAGYDGGRLATAALDHLFVVPSSSVHRIQEVQTTVYHVLWEATVDLLAA